MSQHFQMNKNEESKQEKNSQLHLEFFDWFQVHHDFIVNKVQLKRKSEYSQMPKRHTMNVANQLSVSSLNQTNPQQQANESQTVIYNKKRKASEANIGLEVGTPFSNNLQQTLQKLGIQPKKMKFNETFTQVEESKQIESIHI